MAMINCEDCAIRKFYAKKYDIHLNVKNCSVDCSQKKKLCREFKTKKILGNGKHPEYER